MAAPKRTKLAGGGWEEGEIPSVVAFRLLVPKPAVPSVIGKGGENIKSIRAATQTQIFADDDQAGETTTVRTVQTVFVALWVSCAPFGRPDCAPNDFYYEPQSATVDKLGAGNDYWE
jgi:hypothetical protein